jgi:hypothetical protein
MHAFDRSGTDLARPEQEIRAEADPASLDRVIEEFRNT